MVAQKVIRETVCAVVLCIAPNASTAAKTAAGPVFIILFIISLVVESVGCLCCLCFSLLDKAKFWDKTDHSGGIYFFPTLGPMAGGDHREVKGRQTKNLKLRRILPGTLLEDTTRAGP